MCLQTVVCGIVQQRKYGLRLTVNGNWRPYVQLFVHMKKSVYLQHGGVVQWRQCTSCIVYSYTGSVRVQVTFVYCKNVKDKIRNCFVWLRLYCCIHVGYVVFESCATSCRPTDHASLFNAIFTFIVLSPHMDTKIASIVFCIHCFRFSHHFATSGLNISNDFIMYVYRIFKLQLLWSELCRKKYIHIISHTLKKKVDVISQLCQVAVLNSEENNCQCDKLNMFKI